MGSSSLRPSDFPCSNIYGMCVSSFNRLRELIKKYKEALLPPTVQPSESFIGGDETVLQIHLESALEAIWSASNGSWSKLMDILNTELAKQVSEAEG